MTGDWVPPPEPPAPKPGPLGWFLVSVRAPVMAVVVFGGLLILLIVRLLERPLCGMDRPLTPWITWGVCRAALAIMGLRVVQRGTLLQGRGALVANHTSWLDIFVLNSRQTVYFVSKSEVAGWPGIGWLARATGTLFIRRDRRDARAQAQAFEARLMQGHRLLFFPEGTSTDGLQVLPFKSTLFAAFFAESLKHEIQLQAVSLTYHPPAGADDRFYGWWGDMDFGTSLLKHLSTRRHGHVELTYHNPVRVDDHPNRKTLASHLEDQVRAGHAQAQPVFAG